MGCFNSWRESKLIGVSWQCEYVLWSFCVTNWIFSDNDDQEEVTNDYHYE